MLVSDMRLAGKYKTLGPCTRTVPPRRIDDMIDAAPGSWHHPHHGDTVSCTGLAKLTRHLGWAASRSIIALVCFTKYPETSVQLS